MYKQLSEFTADDFDKVEKVVGTNYWMATTSPGRGIMVGTTSSQENIEYNKRVQECKTARGEF